MLALEETFLSTCRSSRAIILRCNSKTQWQMFLSLYGHHVCVPQKTQIWRLHTKLYKFGWHTSANNSRMKNSRDQILGKVAYISIIYRISDSTFFIKWLWFLFGSHDWWNREFFGFAIWIATGPHCHVYCKYPSPLRSVSSQLRLLMLLCLFNIFACFF